MCPRTIPFLIFSNLIFGNVLDCHVVLLFAKSKSPRNDVGIVIANRSHSEGVVYLPKVDKPVHPYSVIARSEAAAQRRGNPVNI